MLTPFVLAGLALPQEAPGVTPAVKTLSHAELSSELHRLAESHRDLAELHLVGLSREGRAIEALRITAADEPASTPALLLVANLEGPRLFESGVALDHAERLLAGAADGPVRALLESTVVWIVPRANPDAAEGRFATPRAERWTAAHGVDDDRDGREGEDPPSDVNGDGLVTSMRVPDPEGEWMADPADGRALVKAERSKGERGIWKLYPEGRDLDQDEEASEDPPGDVRADRNFPAGWEEHASWAGLFATDEPEARALVEFVMGQKNLGLVLVYDGRDDLVEKPKSVGDDAPAVKLVPPAGLLESDAKLVEELGRRYREATENATKGASPSEGTFARWCYEHRGLITLGAVLWSLPTEDPQDAKKDDGAKQDESEKKDESEAKEAQDETGEKDEPAADERKKGGKPERDEREPSDDAQRLKWIDARGEAWRFVPWSPFDHPELGAVEIGGFAPYARFEPPESERGGIAERHFEFLLDLGAVLPRVSLPECEREALGGDVVRVRAVVANEGLLPLLSRSGRRTGTTRPALVRLVLPEAATFVAGERQTLVSDLPGSGGRKELTWLVHGPSGMEIAVEVDTDHAGTVSREAEEAR
jgi:hypothetical protein